MLRAICVVLDWVMVQCILVGESGGSKFLRNACNTYYKTTRCHDPSNHKRNFQRSGNLKSLLTILTAASLYAGSAVEAILLTVSVKCVSIVQEWSNYYNRWARHGRRGSSQQLSQDGNALKCFWENLPDLSFQSTYSRRR